jgi:surfactin family lipopeptide synthetase A
MSSIVLKASRFSKNLWLGIMKLDRYEQAGYHVTGIYKYSDKIEPQRLEKALQTTVDSNYNLRSNFIEKEGELYHHIHNKIHVKLIRHKLIESDEIDLLVMRYKNMPFDLSSGALFRFVLIESKNNEVTFIVVIHHIICSANEFSRILRCIETNYHSEVVKEESDVKKIKFLKQYLEMEKDKISKGKIEFWEKELIGAPINAHLPYTYLGGNKSKLEPIVMSYKLSGEIYKNLSEFRKAQQYSLFTIMKVVWGTIICNYSRENKIIISYFFDTRSKDYQMIKGAFINQLFYLHDQSMTFHEALEQQKTKITDDYYVPTYKISSKINLNDVAFSVAITQASLLMDEPKLTEESSATISSNLGVLDIFLLYEDNGDELKLTVQSRKDLFDNFLMENIHSHIETVLDQAMKHPNQILSKIDITTPNERYLQSKIWGMGPKQKITFNSITQVFKNIAVNNPDLIAIHSEGNNITYTELNKKSDMLAKFLLAQDFEKQSPIAVSMKRSIQLIISILGILKAGLVYLPLDHALPEERLSYILKDSGAKLLITTSNIKKYHNYQRNLFNIDTDWGNLSRYDKYKLLDSTKSDDLAYIIYTSGSTGMPKAVLLTHATIINLIQWEKNLINEDVKRISQIANISFDVSIQEIMVALLHGKTLYIIPEKLKRKLNELVLYIKKFKINCVFLATALLTYFCDAAADEKISLSDLLILIVSGEQLKITPAIKKFFQKNKHMLLSNEYGPSETHVATVNNEAKSKRQNSSPYIGKPINNMAAYVLDPTMRLTPIGVPGELFLSGVGLMRGYLNRPALTQERLLKNPFNLDKGSGSPYKYLYKTGDLARWRESGDLEYLGRLDTQVKIRGYRVELSAIESFLNAYPDIETAIVVIRSKNENPFLATFYTSEKPIDSELIREYLSKKIPQYIIPSVYTWVEKFPFNINNKVDRAFLEKAPIQSQANYIPPQTATQKQLCKLWCKALNIKSIGIEHDFFSLGGNSLKALGMINKMRTVLNIDIPLTALFRYRTIKNITTAYNAGSITLHQSIIKLNSIQSKIKIFIFHTARGSSEVYIDLAKTIPFSCYGVESCNLYLTPRLNRIDDLCDYYLERISNKITDGDIVYLAGWSFGGILAYKVAQMLIHKNKNIKGVILFDTLHPNIFSDIAEKDINIDWRSRLANYRKSNIETETDIENILQAGKIHDNMYRSIKQFTKLGVDLLLISANSIDQQYLLYRNMLQKNIKMLKEKNPDILIKKINATHETLFQKNIFPCYPQRSLNLSKGA